jgi:hypothetical protein
VSFEAQWYLPGKDWNLTIGGTADSYLTTTTSTIYLPILLHLNVQLHVNDTLSQTAQRRQSTWTLVLVSDTA